MGWALVHLGAALIWFGMFVGVAFFDYEPSRFVVGASFFFTAMGCLMSMAYRVMERVSRRQPRPFAVLTSGDKSA